VERGEMGKEQKRSPKKQIDQNPPQTLYFGTALNQI
jgi:hypothetical protein